MNAKRTPSNQELRTRKDLILAAGRLVKQGRKPSMDEVAEEALVSRATAYRYFTSIDSLLAEASADEAVADPAQLFADDTSEDPEARIARAEASMHETVYRNEAQLRIMLAHSIERGLDNDASLIRQNRRLGLIEAALAPARRRFQDADYEKLCAALAFIVGPESMIVCRDVLRIDEADAHAAKSWAVRALVRAALKDAETRRKK